jgi:hypothetical protein
VVIVIDPLTGKPTTAPRPTTASADDSSEESPPVDANGIRRPPRVRVVMAGSPTGDPRGSPSTPHDRFAPAPVATDRPRKPVVARPAWVHGGRDWTIYVECRADAIVLYPSQRTFALAPASSETADNPLRTAIEQMIERRQSSRRPGEPPYHPQLCLLVRPEHVRTFLTVYPALEALPIPKTRRNLEAEDDVITIVTSPSP